MFFDNSNGANYQQSDVEQLNKALEAGYGTDSSAFQNGRALIPENCEQETINILKMSKEDCKVMSSLKTSKVASTVHEVNLRDDEGDYKFTSVSEGGLSPETSQSLKRKTFDMKFLQTKRGVTQQMLVSSTFEDALGTEKISGINTLMKSCEHFCFHGDSAVVPTQFDGFIAQIEKAANADKNIIDLGGKTISTYGEVLFDDVASKVFSQGGFVDKALFPVALSKDIKSLFEDRIRFSVADKVGNLQQLPDYPTSTGSMIRFTGAGAGADKFYEVKGVVTAAGDASMRPNAPTFVLKTAKNAASKFVAADAGDYTYTVHAVNNAGISAAATVAAPIAVTAGDAVAITITPATSGNAATGYIICRSAKGGKSTMEMVKIADSRDASTAYEDVNAELPGTASMLFLTENKVQSIYKWGQLMPVSTIPLGKRAAIDEFLVATYGALELYAPRYCALVKNIAYIGGLY